MHTFEGAEFQNGTITLDDNCYVECSFDGCTLVYGGGPLEMRRNRLTNCSFVFTDAAERTVVLLSKLGVVTSGAVSLAGGGTVSTGTSRSPTP